MRWQLLHNARRRQLTRPPDPQRGVVADAHERANQAARADLAVWGTRVGCRGSGWEWGTERWRSRCRGGRCAGAKGKPGWPRLRGSIQPRKLLLWTSTPRLVPPSTRAPRTCSRQPPLPSLLQVTGSRLATTMSRGGSLGSCWLRFVISKDIPGLLRLRTRVCHVSGAGE